MEIRPARDTDAEAAAAILREVDDARILSAAAWLHIRRTAQPRQRILQLIATDGNAIVGVGAAGLDTWTSAPGAAWCNVSVTADRRREGVGGALLAALLQHLAGVDAIKATSFIRFSEEGERWASRRGWSRLLTGPLIAVDPRTVSPLALPDGFRFGSMREAGPEAVFEAAA